MEAMIWAGTALTLIGLAGVIWCIVAVTKARRAKLGDDALRQRLQKLIPVNAGALLMSVFGLILVVAGITLSG